MKRPDSVVDELPAIRTFRPVATGKAGTPEKGSMVDDTLHKSGMATAYPR